MHAFGDDALGDLDAVALVDAIRTGKVSRAEVVEAAIARTEAVNPALNGLAHEAFDQALARAYAGTPYGGFFDGVPTFIKDNVDVAGHADHAGHRRVGSATDANADGEFARLYLATGLIPLGKTQMSEFGFSASAEHPRLGRGAQPVEHRLHRGRVVVGLGRVRRRRRGADRPRQRRRRLDPHSGLLQRSGRAQAVARPAAAGRRWRAGMPVRIVANGVLTRSVRDTAAFYREAERIWRDRKLPPIGDGHAARAASG